MAQIMFGIIIVSFYGHIKIILGSDGIISGSFCNHIWILLEIIGTLRTPIRIRLGSHWNPSGILLEPDGILSEPDWDLTGILFGILRFVNIVHLIDSVKKVDDEAHIKRIFMCIYICIHL